MHQMKNEVYRILRKDIAVYQNITVFDSSSLSAIDPTYQFVIIDEVDISLRRNLFRYSGGNVIRGLIHLLNVPLKLFVSATLPHAEKVHLFARWGLTELGFLEFLGTAEISFGTQNNLPVCSASLSRMISKV